MCGHVGGFGGLKEMVLSKIGCIKWTIWFCVNLNVYTDEIVACTDGRPTHKTLVYRQFTRR